MPSGNVNMHQLLDNLDLHQIEQLKLAKQAITYLEGRRRQLQAQIAEIDEEIEKVKSGELDPRKVLPAATGRAEAGRRQRPGSLTAKIVEVLQAKGGAMSVKEVADAVLASGYQTESKNFQQMVGMTLARMEQLEKLQRGVYRLKTS